MKIFSLFILIFWSLVSCDSREKQTINKEQRNTIFSKENDRLKVQKNTILSLADAYELDSAQALLSKIDRSKLENPLYEGLYYYLDAYILDYQEKYGESINQYLRKWKPHHQ